MANQIQSQFGRTDDMTEMYFANDKSYQFSFLNYKYRYHIGYGENVTHIKGHKSEVYGERRGAIKKLVTISGWRLQV